MKKFLAVMFSVLFAFSAFALCAVAEQGDTIACEYCGATFVSTEEYLRHVVEMNKAPNHDVVCCVCGGTFKSKTLLTNHESNYTINDKGQIVCKYAGNGCEEVFASVDAYNSHVDSCVYKSIWTLLKAGKIKEAAKLVDWAKVFSIVKTVFGKVKDIVSGIDLSGVVEFVKNVVSKIPFDKIFSAVKGAIA